MRIIIQKNIGRIFLIFLINISLSIISRAQEISQDSVVNLQNIGYGSQPVWEKTSVVSSVSGDELSKSFTTNLANTLYGRIPGLTVMQGGAEPGEDSPTLYSRGISTFGPNTNPLIIVDGVESTFEKLAPEEIESITLLKDASATAIYGSRGANGVLLITTKRGKQGPLEISLSTQQGFQSALRIPDFLGSYDYSRLYNEALNNDGEPDFYTANDLAAFQSGSDQYFHPDVNWYDELLRKRAPISNYNLNFSGGDSGIRYFASIGTIKSNGLYEKTGDLSENSDNATYNKYNLRLNLDVAVTNRLSMNLNLGGIVENKANPGGNNTAEIFEKMATIPPNAFPVYNPDGSYGGSSIYTNPLGDILESGYYTSNGKTFQGIVKLTEQLDMVIPGLSISGLISFNSFSQSFLNKVRQYARYSISKDNSGNIVYNQIGQNTSLQGETSQGSQWKNYTIQGFLNYDHSFGANTLTGMLMLNADNYSITGMNQSFKHVGVAGRLIFSNQRKYIAEFSFGQYGSENFASGSRFGFFPALSVGWIISNENFLKSNNVLNFLKLRASYGMVGNDNIGGQRFMYYQEYVSGPGYYFGTNNSGFGGIMEGPLANPEVTWEKEKQLDIGIEATILNRFDLSFDIFRKHRYDILTMDYRNTPQFVGYAIIPDLNVGEVDNNGFEGTIRYNSNQNSSFQYFLEGNMWYARNEIIYNAEPLKEYDYLYQSGNSVGQPMLLESIGFFANQADIDSSPEQIFTEVQPGDIKYKDQNNDNIIDQNDYYPTGKPEVPELTYGIHGGIIFKGFDFDFLLQGVANRSVYLDGNYFYAFQNNAKVSTFALGRWTPETAQTADYPRLSAENNLNNFQPSSFWLRNGNFIKLRSIELGYSLSQEVVEKIKIKGLRIFLNGTNLFSVDNIDFTDPETITGYPAFRTISLGLKVKL